MQRLAKTVLLQSQQKGAQADRQPEGLNSAPKVVFSNNEFNPLALSSDLNVTGAVPCYADCLWGGWAG